MQSFLRITFLSIFVFFINAYSFAQSDNQEQVGKYEFGIEVQAYPTGIIPGLRIEKYISTNSSINLRLGYQFIDHRDLGVQDDEWGNGYGFSLAYRRFFKSDFEGFSLAFRSDFWWNQMEWENDTETGTTNITVIQPTLMAEYTFGTDSAFSITPSLSLGWEWNVQTEGAPTGEGAIILIGVAVGF